MPPPQSPTPMATIETEYDQGHECGDSSISESSLDRTLVADDNDPDKQRQEKDADITALKLNCAELTDALNKTIAERNQWKLKMDELELELHAEKQYVEHVETELRNKEQEASRLEDALRECEDRLDEVRKAMNYTRITPSNVETGGHGRTIRISVEPSGQMQGVPETEDGIEIQGQFNLVSARGSQCLVM